MTTYESKWPDGDDPDPGQYVQRIAEMSHELGLENQQMYFKTVDDQGNKDTYEGDEDGGLAVLQEQDVDNVRVAYGDGENRIVFEYDAGAFGKPYRVHVDGDDAFKEQAEHVIGHDLDRTTGQKLKDTVTEKVGEYLTGNNVAEQDGPGDQA